MGVQYYSGCPTSYGRSRTRQTFSSFFFELVRRKNERKTVFLSGNFSFLFFFIYFFFFKGSRGFFFFLFFSFSVFSLSTFSFYQNLPFSELSVQKVRRTSQPSALTKIQNYLLYPSINSLVITKPQFYSTMTSFPYTNAV